MSKSISPAAPDAILLGIWHADGRAACTGALRDWQGKTVPDVLAITGQPWTVLVQALTAAECIDAGGVVILSNDAALVRALSPPFRPPTPTEHRRIFYSREEWVDVGWGGDPQQWQALCLLGGRWGGRFRAMVVDDLPKARRTMAVAVLTKERTNVQAKLDQARAAAVAACLAAYAPQPVKQPDGTTLQLCWNGRIARAYDKLAIARIARDAAAVKALEGGIDVLRAKYNAAAKEAEDAAAAWAALAAANDVTVQSTDVYPPTCTCDGCQAAAQYRDKVQWRAIYVDTLYDFIAPSSADTPPVIALLRRLRNDKGDKEASDLLWTHLRRISDAGEAYAKACKEADVRPNWRALWPDEEKGGE